MGCKKDNISYDNNDCSNKTNEIKKVKALIAGTYTWTHTYRYFFGPEGIISQDTLTPTIIGANIKNVFYKNGTFDVIENNQIKRTYKYSIDYGFNALSHPSDSTTIVTVKDLQTEQQMAFFRPFLCNDSARFDNIYPASIEEAFYKRN
jgi:hypothetical protein